MASEFPSRTVPVHSVDGSPHGRRVRTVHQHVVRRDLRLYPYRRYGPLARTVVHRAPPVPPVLRSGTSVLNLSAPPLPFLSRSYIRSRYTVYLTEAGASRALPTPQRTFLSLQLRLAQNPHARRPWRPQASSAARASSRCSTTTVSRARAAHINGQCKNKTGAGGPSGAIQNLPGTHSKPSHSEHSITLIPK